jgi:HK97 family phage major capsid protein
LTAVQALFRDPQRGHLSWSPEQQQAYRDVEIFGRAMNLTDVNGGLMVPFQLDPAIILGGAGTTGGDMFRQACRTVVATSNVWHGVSSADVTASWDAEAAEVSDDSPTLAGPTIQIFSGRGFIPFSFEVGMDAVNFAQEMGVLLADAKTNLEAQSFVTGDGTTGPKGIVTALVAASKIVTSITADTFALGDLYKIKAALPARFRVDAGWMTSDVVYDMVRQFSTTYAAPLWVQLADDRPPRLLGKPAYEASTFDSVINAGAENHLAVYGDFDEYVIADRIGTTIEFVPHLFGANRRPTGQRGFLMWWRTGADMTVTDACRVLNVT